MKPIQSLRTLTFLLAAALLVSCKAPAQIDWSPDGAHAIYANPQNGNTNLIDAQGKSLLSLDKSCGGFAWSADSSLLYFATLSSPHTTSAAATFHRNDNWLDGTMTGNPATSSSGGPGELTVSQLKGQTQTPLFHIAAQAAWYMTLSSDGKWLALITQPQTAQNPPSQSSPTQTTQLYVFSLDSHTLYPLAEGCSIGVCFTAPNRLAYINSDAKNMDHATGSIVEVTLDETSAQLQRIPIVSVLADPSSWLEARGEDILVTTKSGIFPATSPSTSQPDNAYDLYLWHRADGTITKRATSIGFVFLPSPDGKRILFEKLTDPSTMALAVMNADGSGVQILQDISQFNGVPPLCPNWCGNDQITFLAPPPAAATQPDAGSSSSGIDVVLYHLGPKGLEPIRTLSTTWDDSLKPHK